MIKGVPGLRKSNVNDVSSLSSGSQGAESLGCVVFVKIIEPLKAPITCRFHRRDDKEGGSALFLEGQILRHFHEVVRCGAHQ
jgi:hypothetical protein